MCKIIKYLDYFIIGMIGLFHTCKGLRKYKEILKSNKREEFI
ncbi:hypothetical protein ACQ1DH_001920 [Campylobacter coli]